MHPLVAVTAVLGAAIYPFLEAHWYRVKQLDIPVARSIPELTVLHLSDTHLTAADDRREHFLRSLPGRVGTPDLVLATGDLIENDSGIEPLVTALNALPARLGRFYVLGSHDYYQSRFQSYLKYFGDRQYTTKAHRADTEELERRLQSAGWVSLTNRTEVIDSEHGPIRVAGVYDPYLDRHDMGHITRAADEVVAIGLAHSPDVVSEWVLNGFDLVVAGHTHGGQVRVPGIGAVVTNSTLPAALAGGLHCIGSGWLHVSPGLGTGRFAPIRFNCRPEATLLRLAPA